MKKHVAAVLSIALLLVLSGAAGAADLPLPPKAKPQPTPKVQPKAQPKTQPPARVPPPALMKEETDFDKLGADCIAATDGCRDYKRAADGKFDPASNIGIACQPKPLSCTTRR
ncbi:MAG: hypothetical protein KIS70_11500 [Xanthobacteraceae bacterium]|nr:hypothetical protein [Xanthobacteraceae bacterium]